MTIPMDGSENNHHPHRGCRGVVGVAPSLCAEAGQSAKPNASSQAQVRRVQFMSCHSATKVNTTHTFNTRCFLRQLETSVNTTTTGLIAWQVTHGSDAMCAPGTTQGNVQVPNKPLVEGAVP